VPWQGENLILNPSLNTKSHWSFLRDAEHDASTSRTDDASAAIKLLTPLPKASTVVSDLIAVQPGTRYTYGFYFKTANGPSSLTAPPIGVGTGTYVLRLSVQRANCSRAQ
jgi:hypothetical protein